MTLPIILHMEGKEHDLLNLPSLSSGYFQLKLAMSNNSSSLGALESSTPSDEPESNSSPIKWRPSRTTKPPTRQKGYTPTTGNQLSVKFKGGGY